MKFDEDLITICIITVLSPITIFAANRLQQEILKKRYLTISSPDFQIDKDTGNYVFDIDNNIIWQPLETGDKIVYYGSYAAMIGLPVLYIMLGIGTAVAIYYRKKLRLPISQLQNGVEKIQEDNLDFCIEYSGDDELGQLCCSMEKMRRELRQKHKALWKSLEQRKLLNASVAHDIRTPITVLKGYLDYLEKNIPQDKITEDILLDTVSSMQGAVTRLEQYVDCVRNIEKMESVEIEKRRENVPMLLDEPTAGLDSEERIRFRNLLSEFAENRIVILSTHISSDMESSCDHIGVLDNGRMHKTKDEILNEYIIKTQKLSGEEK